MYSDQLLWAARQIPVVYSDQLLGAARHIQLYLITIACFQDLNKISNFTHLDVAIREFINDQLPGEVWISVSSLLQTFQQIGRGASHHHPNSTNPTEIKKEKQDWLRPVSRTVQGGLVYLV